MMISGVEISIKRSKRKTLSIFVERDGSVTALAPEKIAEDKLREVIISKEYQIHKNLAEWKQLNDRSVHREYVSGQSFMYLGRNYRLRLTDEPQGKLLFSKGKFLLGRSEVSKGKSYFTDFYKEKLRVKILPIIKHHQAQLGVEVSDVKVMELQNRWASCTSNGKLHFHWKCMMAPVDVLHYIVVHELVHFSHPNHTTVFWNDVDKVIPRYQKHKEWLRVHGAGLDV
jgi:predicted metal-dependent hydrolase